MINLQLVSDEDLRKIIADAESEWSYRQDEKLNEKKAKAKRAIEELIAMARSQGKHSLGNLIFECWECGCEFCYDILNDDVLENIVKILGG
jgi:uncharacterized ferredoxin-like protein